MSYPVNYQLKKYRPRELTEQQVDFCEAYLAHQSPSYAAKIVGYKSPKRAGAFLLKSKRILDYLAKRQKQIANVHVTFEDKIDKLATLVDQYIPDNGELILPKQASIAIDAIAEMNKMQGHYAPTQNQNFNVSVKTDTEQAQAIANELNKLDRYTQSF